MLITYVLIIPKCFLIHVIAAGFFLIGLKFSHLKLGLFNYTWIRLDCVAALKDCALWSSLEGKIFVVLGGGIKQDGEPSPGTISRTGYFNIVGCASTSVDSLQSYQAPVSPRLFVVWCSH